MGDELHTMASSVGRGDRADRTGERRPIRQPGPRRYALMLATIVASFAIQGIASPAAWGTVAVTCLLGATLLLALWVVQFLTTADRRDRNR